MITNPLRFKTMKHYFLWSLGAIALALAGCHPAALDPADSSGRITFRVGRAPIGLMAETKAEAVDDDNLTSDGFMVSCVDGNPGEDGEVWSNVTFTRSGNVWQSDKWWPQDDGAYRFYAVYPSGYTLTHAGDGASIEASNEHDIVAAYAGDPVFRSVNTLPFSHIFARLKTVTVTASDGYTISDVTIRITPKVSGTYNLFAGAGHTDGTGWSDTVEADSPVSIASSTFSGGVSTQDNDLYLVPGTYALTASWTASKGVYTESFENMTVEVDLAAGKTNNISAYLTGNAEDVGFNTRVTAWGDNAVTAGTFPAGPPPEPLNGLFTVNGEGKQVRFSPGNLQAVVGPFAADLRSHVATQWKMASHQYDAIGDGNADYAEGSTVDLFAWVGESVSTDSYGLLYSSYNNNDTGQVTGESLKTDWGSIPGVISGLGRGWRTMSRDEWDYLLHTRTVTNNQWSGARFILAQIDGIYNGIILFPDNYTHPAGTDFAPYREYGEYKFNIGYGGYANTTVSLGGWALMEAAGCVFLPAGGTRDASHQTLNVRMDTTLDYWTSTSSGSTIRAYRLNYASGSSLNLEEANRYYESSVRLVKDAE